VPPVERARDSVKGEAVALVEHVNKARRGGEGAKIRFEVPLAELTAFAEALRDPAVLALDLTVGEAPPALPIRIDPSLRKGLRGDRGRGERAPRAPAAAHLEQPERACPVTARRERVP
jgi:hypothetical protein